MFTHAWSPGSCADADVMAAVVIVGYTPAIKRKERPSALWYFATSLTMKADNSCAKAARDPAVAKRISASIAMVDTRFFAAVARTLSHARSRMARAASPTRYPIEKVSRCSAGEDPSDPNAAGLTT